MPSALTDRLEGAAMLFAIFVLVWCVILSMAMISTVYIESIYFEHTLLKKRLINNVNSGINLLMSEKYSNKPIYVEKIDLFNQLNDSIKISKKNWGVFEVVSSMAFKGNHNLSKTALVGSTSETKTALYFSDSGKPLYVCGNTLIKGSCFIPQAGVKTAFIEGQNFNGQKIIDGAIYNSSKSIPPIKKELNSELKDLYNLKTIDNDLWELTPDRFPDSLTRSFLDKRGVFHSKEPIKIDESTVIGHIVVSSDKSIIVSDNSTIANAILVAPYIKFMKGSNSQVQAFASDSLTVEDNVNLQFPSVLCLMSSTNNTGSSHLTIGKKTTISGNILAGSFGNSGVANVSVSINELSTIIGQVYCYGSLDLKGKVYGGVYTNKIILKTGASVYENHLLNSEINASKLPDKFASGNIISNYGEKKILKWIYH